MSRENTTQRTFIVIPSKAIWNDKAIVDRVYYHPIDSHKKAVEAAGKLSRQYNMPFLILEIGGIVSHTMNVEPYNDETVKNRIAY